MTQEKNYEFNSLDNRWINEFEKTDKKFKPFYLSDVMSIHITCIYVNKSNEIESKSSCKNISFLHPNVLSREEMIYLLKKNSFLNGIRYKLSSILKYNIHDGSHKNIMVENICHFHFSNEHILEI